MGAAGHRAPENEEEQHQEHDRHQDDVEQLLRGVLELGHVAPGQRERVGQGLAGADPAAQRDLRRGHGLGGYLQRGHAALPSSSISDSSGPFSAWWPVRVRNTSSRLGSRNASSAAIRPASSIRRTTAGSSAGLLAGAGTRPGSSVTSGTVPVTSATIAAPWPVSDRSDARTTRVWPPVRDFSSAGVPSATTRPRSITAIRSASSSASSRYWVVSSTVAPPATTPRMVSHTWLRARGSSPVVGSSRNSTWGSPTRLAARSRRRRMPPE